MGLCGLARLLLLGSVLNMKETERHTHRHAHTNWSCYLPSHSLAKPVCSSFIMRRWELLKLCHRYTKGDTRTQAHTHTHSHPDLVSIFFCPLTFRRNGLFYFSCSLMTMQTAKILFSNLSKQHNIVVHMVSFLPRCCLQFYLD